MNKRFVTASILLTLGGGVLSNLTTSVFARQEATCDDTATNCKVQENTALNVRVTSYLALQMDATTPGFAGEINFDDILASPNGDFRFQSIAARVYTSPNIGYQLTLNDIDNDTNMLQSDTSIESKIESLASEITTDHDGENFPLNKWGYAVGDFNNETSATFLPVPPLSAPERIGYRDEPNFSGFDDVMITFAIKPSGMLTPGVYSDVVQFTASALLEPEFKPGSSDFFSIKTMQQMNDEICSSLPTPNSSAREYATTLKDLMDNTDIVTGISTKIPQTTLKDTRDENVYTVRKLADGNCWMADNLKYDFVAGTTLTPNNSDVNSDWTIPAGASTIVMTAIDGGPSWGQNDGTVRAIKNNISGNASQGEYYYSWFAATAGQGSVNDIATTTDGTRIINGNVQNSICPKGWRLPAGSNKTKKSFYSLFKAYYPSLASSLSGTTDIVTADPFNFALSGFYYLNGSIRNSGTDAYYWSSTAYAEKGYTYGLYANNSDVYPGTNYFTKGYGFNIRCVSR